MSIDGIDVSGYQLTPDWSKVAAAGTVFVYAKATDGLTVTDTQFMKNWAAIKHAGMRRGAYHFFRPLAKPEDQADHFCKVVGSLEPGDLPPAVDLEWTNQNPALDEWPKVPKADRVGLVVRFLERVEQTLGMLGIVYTSAEWVKEAIPDASALATRGLWVVDYSANVSPQLPPAWNHWLFRQYSGSGNVSGITTKVDLDNFNGSADDLANISKKAAAGPALAELPT
jgi:lysozyme